MWQLVFASGHRLIHQEEEQQQEDAERVPDGHDRSFGSWPLQKTCLDQKSLKPAPACLANLRFN